MRLFLKNTYTSIAIVFIVAICLSGNAFGQISADFNTSNTEACNSLQTTFFDQSTSAESIIDWSWNLDGNTSLEQNPSALFTEPGSFTICLTVTDVSGNTDTECKEDYIVIFPNPIAAFTLDNTEGCAPVAVSFSDQSSSENGSIISWLWDVGGSVGVLEQTSATNFTSTYNIQGSYTSSLTVVDEKGCAATTSTPNSVVVSTLRSPDIDIELIPSCSLPWEVNFTNNNSDPLIDYTWDFGNGQLYEGISPPTITYTDVDSYDITIYMSSGECRDTFYLEKAIDTKSSAAFSYSPAIVCQNGSVKFTDESLVEAESVTWAFGDGSSSSNANPDHIYTAPGCYDVSLIRMSGSCIDTVTISCIQVLPEPQINYSIDNQYNCNLPTEVVLHGESDSPGNITWQYLAGGPAVPKQNDDTITIENFGLYHATLQFDGQNGCDASIDSIPIDIAPLEVYLPVIGPSGCVPFTFTLMDSAITQVPIVSWDWSIGNPTIYTSSSSTPSFTIPDTGRYDVQLIVTNANGCIDTILVEDYVGVGLLPEVNFEGSPLISCASVAKDFTDLSSGYVDSWEWFFGGNGYSEEQHPTFHFNGVGSFDVALYASHNGCTDSLRFTEYVTILEPVSNFVPTYNCEDPYTVSIENRSHGADSLLWTLELSENLTETFTDSIFGQYTFPGRGEYPLTHYSYNYTTECEDIFTDTIKIVDPIASYVVDTLRGCAPFDIQIGNFSQDAFTYEFVSDVAEIDSIFNSEPVITFNEGGILNGPLLIITDIHECQDSFQLSDSIQVNKLEARIDFNEVICVPDVAEFKDRSIDILGNIISWNWEIAPVNHSSTEDSTSLYIDSVGLYDIYFKVVDDWGCEDSLVLPSAIHAVEIIPDFTYDTLSCTWASIKFKSLGDNGHVAHYEWDFGDGTISNEINPSHNYATEGIYSVCLTMTDSRGCSKFICKEDIIVISDPVASYSGDPSFAFCPPLLTNFENSSTQAFTYEWGFGDNSGRSTSESPSHVYTSPGRFDVMLIAQSTADCKDTLIIPEYIIVEGPKGDFIADVSETCLPIDVVLQATSDGYYSYVWDLGNGILDSVGGLVIEDTIMYSYDTPGKYTPKLIITDSIGCSRSFAGDPIIVDHVDIDFTIDSNINCGVPSNITLENLSNGTTDDIAFQWVIEGPSNYESEEENPTILISETGAYDVSLIAEYSTCIDTISIDEFLEVADIPVVSFEILADELCENVDVQFNNTSSVGYGEFIEWKWDFGDGNTSSEVSPNHQYLGLESQFITLIGITDKGCEASFSAGFDVLPSTVASVEEDKLICIGDEVQLHGAIENLQEGGDFFWEANPALSCTDCFSPIANPIETTSFVLVGVHPNGCESRDTIEVVVIPTPGPELALAADSIICLGSSSIIDVLNFNPGYNYIWNNTIPGQDCYEDCDQVVVNPENISTYYVTVYNEFGCFKEDSVTVDVETSFENFLTESAGICDGDATTISITAGNNINWKPDPEISCEGCESNEVSPDVSQYFYASVESTLGCIYTDSIFVVVVPRDITNAGEDKEICKGEEIQLTAAGVGVPLWIDATGEIIDSASFETYTIPSQSGTINLIMTYDDCVQYDSLYVQVFEKADIMASGDSICVGDTAHIEAYGMADQYTWDIDSEFAHQSKVSLFPDSTTLYQVIGNYRTCIPDTAIVEVFVHPSIGYSVEVDKYDLYLNDEVTLEPDFDIERNYTFDWFPPEGLDCDYCPDPTISGLTISTDYSLMITDEETGCQAEQEIKVRFVNECTQSIFHVANIFSPNGDGTNDEFGLITNNPEEFISMQIFDRYGNLLHNTSDINETWDGKFNSQYVVPGVYVYKINIICPYTLEESSILGDVTVVR